MGGKSLFLALLLFFPLAIRISEGSKRVSIPDDLDDVVDDEEDEAWKEWGTKKRSTEDEFDPRSIDFSHMSPTKIQSEFMKHHTGPSLGFIKLRPGVPRSREDVPLISMRWTKVLRTGSIEAKFMAVDLNTIMFNMERGQDIEELKEFILNQPEAYEIKIGEQLYRRPGDPPLEEVIEMLQRQKIGAAGQDPTEESKHLKDEL